MLEQYDTSLTPIGVQLDPLEVDAMRYALTAHEILTSSGVIAFSEQEQLTAKEVHFVIKHFLDRVELGQTPFISAELWGKISKNCVNEIVAIHENADEIGQITLAKVFRCEPIEAQNHLQILQTFTNPAQHDISIVDWQE